MSQLLKVITLLIITICPIIMEGQEESKQCLKIDFETINGAPTVENMAINTQFFGRYGVTFQLENGNSPVIAQVGGTATAFGSVYGNDQAAPTEDIGTYFITDDGLLSGLSAIPLIVRFDNPLDSLSAVILDMDFDEVFTVEARDINEVPIFTSVIRAGDPGTGDGLATPFGFNLEGCEGAIYSLRFEGSRNTAGAFGLGMDNFILCFSGIDIEKNLDLTAIPENCNSPGSIVIENNSENIYEYSLDGITYVSFETFNNLPAGDYTIFVRDDAGCSAELELTIPLAETVMVANASVQNTTCGDDNGSIIIDATGTDLEYSIDGITYFTDPLFRNMPSGDYFAYAIDTFGCIDSFPISVGPSVPLSIAGFETTVDSCEAGVGTIIIVMPPGDSYLYKINGGAFIPQNTFSNLAVGSYDIQVVNGRGCLADSTIDIQSTPQLIINQISSDPAICLDENGNISFTYSGGTGMINIILNDEPLINQTSPILDLNDGEYTLTIIDELGCQTEENITVEQEICLVFVGNIFTPNSDGENDNFPLITLNGYEAQVMRYLVFDRWGNKVFDSRNFSIHDNSYWWDGKSNGQPAVPGVYVFTAEILHPNGKVTMMSGDVTLLR